MKKSVILVFGIVLFFSLYSYDVNADECGECVCEYENVGGEVRGAYEFVLKSANCPRDRPYAICGYEHYAEGCRNFCVCKDSPIGREGEEAVCGNERLERGEQCEGNNFGGAVCSDFGNFNRGNLRCDECRINTDGCYYEEEREDEGMDLRLYVEPGGRMRRVSQYCPGNSENFRLTLRNYGEAVDTVYMYDTVYYDANCDGNGRVYLNRIEFICGNLVQGSTCARDYRVTFYFPGCYYHNIFVSSGRIGV